MLDTEMCDALNWTILKSVIWFFKLSCFMQLFGHLRLQAP